MPLTPSQRKAARQQLEYEGKPSKPSDIAARAQESAKPQEAGIQARDFAREQQFAKKVGGTPSSPRQADLFYQAVYTPTEYNKLQSLGAIAPYQDPFTPARAAGLGLTPEQTGTLTPAGQQLNVAQEGMAGTTRPTNTALGVLQQALNAKKSVTNQALGTSELFQKAGLTGYENLSQSIAERSREMNDRYDSFKAQVSDVSTAMTDTYNLALDKYNLAKTNYDDQLKIMLDQNREIRAHERQLELLREEDKLAKERAQLQGDITGRPSPTAMIAAGESGKVFKKNAAGEYE